MEKKFNEKQIINLDDIKININDITTFLYKSNLLNKTIVDDNQLSILNMNTKINLIDFFEFNNAITIKEATNKYNGILKSLKQIFKVDLKFNLESLYHKYLELTNSKLQLNHFLNCLIMLNYILTNFKEILNLQNNTDFINVFHLDKPINIILLDNINISNDKDTISYKLEQLYEKIKESKESKEQGISNYLIILILILSLDGNVLVDSDKIDKLNLLQKFNLYNKIYISNIYLSLVLYIQMELMINLYINTNISKNNSLINHKNKYQDLSRNEQVKNNNFTFTRNINLAKINHKTQLLSTNRKLNNQMNKNNLDENESNNNSINVLQNYYLFNDEFINKKENKDTKIILFQNYLKFFSFYSLNKNKIYFDFNLSIESISNISEN